jgi:hypothetical protein
MKAYFFSGFFNTIFGQQKFRFLIPDQDRYSAKMLDPDSMNPDLQHWKKYDSSHTV